MRAFTHFEGFVEFYATSAHGTEQSIAQRSGHCVRKHERQWLTDRISAAESFAQPKQEILAAWSLGEVFVVADLFTVERVE